MLLLVALLVVAEVPIAEPEKPLWLLERSSPTRITARTFGKSGYNKYTAGTTLSIGCTGNHAALYFAVDVKALGFDSDPYEGPDATKNGPLLLTTAGKPAVSHNVSGYWGFAGSYQVGSPFVFEAQVPASELTLWLADGTRGQAVHGELDGLTFDLKWPRNSEALRTACKAE